MPTKLLNPSISSVNSIASDSTIASMTMTASMDNDDNAKNTDDNDNGKLPPIEAQLSLEDMQISDTASTTSSTQ
jgi:hypothetical protein